MTVVVLQILHLITLAQRIFLFWADRCIKQELADIFYVPFALANVYNLFPCHQRLTFLSSAVLTAMREEKGEVVIFFYSFFFSFLSFGQTYCFGDLNHFFPFRQNPFFRSRSFLQLFVTLPHVQPIHFFFYKRQPFFNSA